jgi:hypothetical protein
MRSNIAPAALLLLSIAGAADADTVIFNESEFNPGSWSAYTPFFSSAPNSGETMSVSTDRFIGGNPANAFMLTQYMVDFPGGFNVAHAPVMLTDFAYDPSVNGAITSIAASMRTLLTSTPDADAYVGVRLYIVQDGRLYATSGLTDTWGGFNTSDPDQVRNFSGFTADDFVEYLPQVGVDLESRPDFAGPAMQFGFGIQLTSTGLVNDGQITRVVAFDDVSLRIQTVPTPGAGALLALAALPTRRRRA